MSKHVWGIYFLIFWRSSLHHMSGGFYILLDARRLQGIVKLTFSDPNEWVDLFHHVSLKLYLQCVSSDSNPLF